MPINRNDILKKPNWGSNIGRVIVFPLTQLFMAVGIFPAQAISTAKKIPVLGSLVRFITRKISQDSRPALKILTDDYQQRIPLPVKRKGLGAFIDWFTKGPRIEPPTHDELDRLECHHAAREHNTVFGNKTHLETFTFTNKDFNAIPMEHRYYRIHIPGNSGSCSRFFSELAKLSLENPELQTITYNHPGVEGSGGITMSKADLINAALTQVLHLLNQGVPADHIELTGFSIGAATAVHLKKLLDQANLKVNIFCDRTFGTMSNVVTDKFPLLGSLFTALKLIPGMKELCHKFIQPIFKYLIIKPLLFFMNWNYTPADYYKNFDSSQKGLSVVDREVRGEGRLQRIAAYFGKYTGIFTKGRGDKTISKHASLAEEVKDDEKDNAWNRALNALQLDINAAQQPSESTYEDLLKNSDNAISFSAIKKLKKHTDDQGNDLHDPALKKLVSLVTYGKEARALAGPTNPHKNAHDVIADQIYTRVAPHIARDAYEAVTGERKDRPVTTLLDQYSIFHKSIKTRNELEVGAKADLEALDGADIFSP